MQELQNAVANAFANVVAAGTIEKAIEEKLSKTITSIIDDELRSYSDFGKSLSEQVKAALAVDFSNLGIPGYNDLILKVVRRQVDAHVNSVIATQVESQLTELLESAPESITLTQLVAEFIKDRSDYHGCSCDGPDEITLVVDGSSSVDGYHNIYLDEEGGKSKYSCAIQIATNKEHTVYSLKIDDRDPKKTLFVGPLYNFERRLFQMYAAGTKLIIDATEDDIDTSYPGRDY
jgi:hypothetical protein